MPALWARAANALRFSWVVKLVCVFPALLYFLLFQCAPLIVDGPSPPEIDISTLPAWEAVLVTEAAWDVHGWPHSTQLANSTSNAWWIGAIDLATAGFYAAHFLLFPSAVAFLYYTHSLSYFRTPRRRKTSSWFTKMCCRSNRLIGGGGGSYARFDESIRPTGEEFNSAVESADVFPTNFVSLSSSSSGDSTHSFEDSCSDFSNIDVAQGGNSRNVETRLELNASSSYSSEGEFSNDSAHVASADGKVVIDLDEKDACSSVLPLSTIFLPRGPPVDHHGWPAFEPWTYILSFGLMCLAAVATQLAWPTAPPWWYVEYPNATHASYDTEGSAAGLARSDAILGFPLFESAWGASPIVFGSFPSLHVAFPSLITMHMPSWKWRIVMFFYSCMLIFSAMSLLHHWFVDCLGGVLYAAVSALLAHGIIYLLKHVPLLSAHLLSSAQSERNRQHLQTGDHRQETVSSPVVARGCHHVCHVHRLFNQLPTFGHDPRGYELREPLAEAASVAGAPHSVVQLD